MNEIKEYKTLCKITCYDGTEIYSESSQEDLLRVLNSGIKFVNIGDIVIATADVRRIEKATLNGIEDLIRLEPDVHKREVMKYRYDRRAKEGFKTSGLEHLITICENHKRTKN